MAEPISLRGTRGYKAAKIRRKYLGWPGSIFALLLLVTVAGLSIEAGQVLPFALMLGVVVFFRHVVSLYLSEQLENDAMPLPKGAPEHDKLSADLVCMLATNNIVSAGELFDASLMSKRGAFLLAELGINAGVMSKACRTEINSHINTRDLIAKAADYLVPFQETRVGANLILYTLFVHIESCKQMLRQADMSLEDLDGLIRWERMHDRFKAHENPLSPAAITRSSRMGRSWVTGYTDALDALTAEVDCHARTTGEMSTVIHTEAIQNILRVLTRNRRRNVLILGGQGVGKKTMVENIACALRNFERETHASFTRVLVLRTEKLLSGVGDPASVFYQALSRASNSGRIILVIRDLSSLLASASGSLKSVLMKCMESDTISVIGVADARDYHASIKSDAGLDSQMEKVTVEDATDEETMAVMMAHYFALERRNIRITYKALKSILELSKRYLSSRSGFPGKAIDVMDESIMRAADHGHAYVTEEHVRDVVSAKGKVNVKRVDDTERDRLLNIESVLKSRIIGQDVAVKAVSGALKRARIDLADRKRPVGTFLFLGPTGVGKTQTAKALAQEYFGSADAMIRLDMNEFSHADSAASIIGSGTAEGFLSQRVQDKPFSLILLDEIEKAHPAVLNLFLQILDEGFLTDARGIKTDFRNTIIIATSNAGALFIRDFVREHQNFGKEEFKTAVVETILREKMFAPEFINRFDETVLFHPLSKENAQKVAMLMLGEIIGDIEKRRGVHVTVEEDVITAIVQRGYSAEFGAREMRRTITDMIEDYLADYMLRNNVKRGESIQIRAQDLSQ